MVADHDLAGIQTFLFGGIAGGIDNQRVKGAHVSTAQLMLLKNDLLREAFGELNDDSI